jgi:hypothetical protein
LVRTLQACGVTRVKRTYNLPERTVRLVRDLATVHGLAETQDGVVELAVDELARHLREAREAEAWAAAAADPEFATEVRSIERETTPAERDSWRSW